MMNDELKIIVDRLSARDLDRVRVSHIFYVDHWLACPFTEGGQRHDLCWRLVDKNFAAGGIEAACFPFHEIAVIDAASRKEAPERMDGDELCATIARLRDPATLTFYRFYDDTFDRVDGIFLFNGSPSDVTMTATEIFLGGRHIPVRERRRNEAKITLAMRALMEMGIATLLGNAAQLTLPCCYQYRARSDESAGGLLAREVPFYRTVHASRVHTLYPKTDRRRTLKAHDRRGHEAYLWKASGLPEHLYQKLNCVSAMQRLAWADQFHITTCHKPPCRVPRNGVIPGEEKTTYFFDDNINHGRHRFPDVLVELRDMLAKAEDELNANQ